MVPLIVSVIHAVNKSVSTAPLVIDLNHTLSDTIDTTILLHRLKLLNMNNDALILLKDYITNLTRNIKLKSIYPNKTISFVESQATVLGPSLYIYTYHIYLYIVYI